MKRIILFLFVLNLCGSASAQKMDSSGTSKTLRLCIQYALEHQTNIRQSMIDQQIVDREIKSALADWYPQIGLNANYQDNFQLQTSIFNNQASRVGTYNSSSALLGITQTVFDRDVLLAKQSARDVRTSARQTTVNTQIDVVSNVSKAFYDVLLSKEQIRLFNADLVLLQRSLKDAYNQYKGGLVDKTDYQRATISLNNSKAQLKTAEEELKSRYALLKLYMSYPSDSALMLTYDSAEMANQITAVDTNLAVDYNNRIEYQQLQTQKRLEQANLRYAKNAYLPSVYLFGEYNLNYYSDQFSKLYSINYPNSYAGVMLSFPIFQGTKRIQQIHIAQLQLDRLDYNFTSLKDSINAEYVQALGSYKSNLANYYLQKENLNLALEVYNVIQLQYRSGIKAYLDVVTANNDLFGAQINYTNALYQVLSNKVDVERALGVLRY
jgi:outer membrane protein